jgi:hypothetical protein
MFLKLTDIDFDYQYNLDYSILSRELVSQRRHCFERRLKAVGDGTGILSLTNYPRWPSIFA